MKRKINIKKIFALLMALLMLAALLPAVAFTESDMAEYGEDADSDYEPDFFEETEEIICADDDPWVDWANNAPALEADNEVLFGGMPETRCCNAGRCFDGNRSIVKNKI